MKFKICKFLKFFPFFFSIKKQKNLQISAKRGFSQVSKVNLTLNDFYTNERIVLFIQILKRNN